LQGALRAARGISGIQWRAHFDTLRKLYAAQ